MGIVKYEVLLSVVKCCVILVLQHVIYLLHCFNLPLFPFIACRAVSEYLVIHFLPANNGPVNY